MLTDVRLPNGAMLNYDQWDGYAPGPARLLVVGRRPPTAPIVLTGDIHLAGVGRLPGVGIEFVSTSICSGGLVPADFQASSPTSGDIVGAELAHRGYTRHAVDAGRVDSPSTASSTTSPTPSSAVPTWQSFVGRPVDARRRRPTVGAG